MSEYFNRVWNELRGALRRGARHQWYRRVQRHHRRALILAIAGLIVSGSALVPAAALQLGSSVMPEVPPTPNAVDGVAIPATAQLLAMQVPDPHGGPNWGMRTVETTRGLVCVTVGRIAFGRVGALGQDGAFGNDQRFTRSPTTM